LPSTRRGLKEDPHYRHEPERDPNRITTNPHLRNTHSPNPKRRNDHHEHTPEHPKRGRNYTPPKSESPDEKKVRF
jgi:hypothetical protein